MPSKEYLETILEKTKEYLPEWLFNEIHSIARATAGGKTRAKNIVAQVEKLLLEEMNPETLAEVPDTEVSQAWLRLNQWYALAKKENRSIENYVNAAIWVIGEMKKRNFNISEDNELLNEAEKFKNKSSFRKELKERFNNLPKDIMVVKDFVNIVGSTATDKQDPDDLDILFRATRDDNDHFLIQSENIWVPVRKVLDPNKEGILHYIDNPQGSHANYMCLYDLVLRRKDVLKTTVVKQAPEMPEWESYLIDIPEGPRLDLGCGENPAQGFQGVDVEPYEGIDHVTNLEDGIPFENDSVAAIRANHSLEHLSSIDKIMDEIYRVLKPNGVAIITVPSTEGIGATAHPDHKTFWNLDTFKEFDKKFKIEYLQNRERQPAVDVDAVLRKPKPILKELQPYEKFIPPKPEMAGYTEVFNIEDLLKWSNGKYPIGIEQKFNGFRGIAEKKNDETRLWFEGQYGKNQLNKIPEIQKILNGINEDFIIDTDLGLLKDGKREPRTELMKFNREKPEFISNETPILSVFDIIYYRENLTDKPFEERRKILEEFYKKYLSNKKNFSLSPVKWCQNENEIKVAAKWAFKQDNSEGLMAKTSTGKYSLNGATDEWFKMKKVIEIKVIVLDKKETKTPNVFNYWGGLSPSLEMDYANIKDLKGEKYIDLGKTFSTSINANIGDILTVQVLEIIPDEEKRTLAWLGPRVIDIDDTRKEPYFVSQAVEMAQRADILQKELKDYVPSVGPRNAKIAFIGASPSNTEVARNEPFVGPSGETFNDLYLKPLGLDRKEIFITNVVPKYLVDESGRVREPNTEEINTWSTWLNSELEKANPKIIVALGQTAKKALGNKADFVLPHPMAIRRFNDSGELGRKLKQVKQAISKALEEGDTRAELAADFWKNNWFKMYPKSGKGKFVYQHHWRGLTEEESKLPEKDLLNTNHSIHGDLRLEGPAEGLWGFSVFTGTAAANKTAGGDRLIVLPQNDNLQGQFKLEQPKEWLSAAHGKPYVSEPEGVGATALKYAKFFEEDAGTYEIGAWREHMVEIFLHGEKLKGRFIIEYAPVAAGKRVWIIDRPKDQTPYIESHKLEDVIQELKTKGQKYLIWAKPNVEPKLINIENEKVSKEYYAEIIKADNDKQIVCGIVLEPDSMDAQGDIINADEIEKAAHYFLTKSRTIGDKHKKKAPAELVESYTAPVNFVLGNQNVKKGTWIISVKINDKKMWQDVKDGKYTGFSVGGYGVRQEVQNE